MKKLRSVMCIIIAALLIGCFTASAFAESETVTGTYDGYGFVASANCSYSSCSSSLSYSSGYTLRINSRIGYMDIYGSEQYVNFNPSNTHYVAVFPALTNFAYFISNNSKFYINNSKVATITVYPN